MSIPCAVHVEPATPPVAWDQFCAVYPRGSIALDGFVHGRPRFCPSGPHATFDHHADVSRLQTRATCAQVLLAIHQGLLDAFAHGRGCSGGSPEAGASRSAPAEPRGAPAAEPLHVWVNDCDEDVATAVFLLRHPECVAPGAPTAWRMNRLVGIEDAFDTTSGCYGLPPGHPVLEEIGWIYQPYRDAKRAGLLDGTTAEVYRRVIDAVGYRIGCYLRGTGGRVPLTTGYTVHARVGDVAWVEEIGEQARLAMCAAGIRLFLSVRPRGEGRWQYSIGKVSEYVRGDLEQLHRELDALEPATHVRQAGDTWGGASLIIGSPRCAASALPPETVWQRVLAMTQGEPATARAAA